MTFRRIKPMLLVDDGRMLDHPDFVLEEKFDGTRAILIKQGNKVRIWSRSWHEYTHLFPIVLKEAQRIKADQVILDGEMTFFKHGRDFFLTISATTDTKRGFTPKYMAFDILEINHKSVRNLTLLERRKLLNKLIPAKLTRIKVVKIYFKNKRNIYNEIVKEPRQAEGAVLKHKDSIYREDYRSPEWLKLKSWKTDDVVILGVTHGTGVRVATFGSLILGQFEEKKLRHVGNSSGFSIEEQKELIKRMKPLRINKSPVSGLKINAKYWCAPKLVAEVKFLERTKYNTLRMPSFIRIREDKLPEECVVTPGRFYKPKEKVKSLEDFLG